MKPSEIEPATFQLVAVTQPTTRPFLYALCTLILSLVKNTLLYYGKYVFCYYIYFLLLHEIQNQLNRKVVPIGLDALSPELFNKFLRNFE
jgi:hypothetical protein